MMRRILVGLLAFCILLVGSYASYSWWTRRNPVSFGKGPAFGAVQSASASPTSSGATLATSATPTPAASGSTPTNAPTKGPTASQKPVTSDGVTVRGPANGAYTFDGSGTERVQMSGASPCSWQVKDVSLVVNDDGNTKVFDWTISSQHQERLMIQYRPAGMFTAFAGAAVTCLGVRQTNEDDYSPPIRRVAFPLKVGTKWTSTSKTKSRTEKIRGTILARETLTLPAGKFDTFKVQVRGTLSGGQEGTYVSTMWISPELGLQVKQTADVDVRQGSTSFTSKVQFLLRSHP
ncbi:MAG: hypothetical protein WDA27_01200 [Actinomycetota bacterium]